VNKFAREIACLTYNDAVFGAGPTQARPKSGAEARLELTHKSLTSGPENAGTLYGHETLVTPHQHQTPTPDASMTKSPKLLHTSDFNQIDFLQIQNKQRTILRASQLHNSESNIHPQMNRSQGKDNIS
jgi:hypothetical protein